MEDTSLVSQSVEKTASDENTIKFKRTHLYAALLPLAFVLGLAVGYIFWGRVPAGTATTAAVPSTAGNTTDPSAASDTANVPQEVRRYDIPTDDDPSLGPANAAITIIEFSDYECPYCTRWHNEVWPLLQATYPDKVRLVYRDFPLSSIHSNAISAAEAANCAGDQDAYWEFHALLFEGKYGLGRDAYQKYASELNLDSDTLDQCVESRKYQAEVEADYNYAAELGIRSTPTFFVNGIAVVGAQPFEVFKELIDLELAGKLDK